MRIENKLAKEIVLKLSETIGQDINIMDTKGVIIASSDSTRVGHVHEGAVKLLNEKLPKLIIESDTQYEGARNGVNLPVIIEDEIVGTIGITGEVNEVLKYGEIIKHMTEILLLEGRAQELKVMEQKTLDRFYEEWITGALEEKNPTEFQRQAKNLSIDTDKSYRILVLNVRSKKPLNSEKLTKISGIIRKEIKKEVYGNAFRTATHMVCIIDDTYANRIDSLIGKINNTIKRDYSCSILVGAASCGAMLHLTDSYEKAGLALNRAISYPSDNLITYYDDFDIYYMLKRVSPKVRDNYMDKLFKEMDSDEREQALILARIYLEENGSIQAISEKMFVHKNTIKYRISKLTQATGIDIRTCYGAYIFMMACMLSS